jgi:D-alanyl-D-alanine carboxypeptidase (penicillin-binding protein 5/6)
LPKSFIDRNTASPYVILGNVTDGRILYTKNAEAKCYPASLTKLMTAVVAVENMPSDAIFTVGNEVYMIDPQSSRAYLAVGTRLTLENLLQAMLLPSGNDAAYVLGVQVGRAIAGDENLDSQAAVAVFAKKMNEKAAALGCVGTHFVNPDGIHDNNHYTTAADMLKIAACALQNEMISRVVATPAVNTTLLSGHAVSWRNSNRLVQENNAYSYAGATGLKTGSTDEAGYCLAASASRDGKTCVAVVMGSKTESGRWEDASGLLDISFQ